MHEYDIESSSRFFDESFPRGFSKSGDFTIKESELLHLYGHTLLSLQSGQRQPISEDEQHFLQAITGKAEPINTLEKAWLKYMGLKGKRNYVNSFGTPVSRPVSPPELETDDFEDLP